MRPGRLLANAARWVQRELVEIEMAFGIKVLKS
jgi:hypothetical protein